MLCAVVIASAVTAAWSCEASSPPELTATTDSAGVVVVTHTNASMAGVPSWALSEDPILTVQTEEGGSGPALYQVSTVVPLANGRVAVGNGGTKEVLLVDSLGAVVGMIGGEGEGPGEMASIGSVVAMRGDSLGVYDSRRKRYSVFGPEAVVGRTFEIQAMSPAGESSGLLPLTGGDFILFREEGPAADVGNHRPLTVWFRLSHDGALLDSLGPFPGRDSYRSSDGWSGPVLFGSQTQAATLGKTLVVGTAGIPEIREYDESGNLIRIVRWPDHDRVVTEAEVGRFIDASLATLPEAQRPMARDMLAGIPVAAQKPVYERLVVSDNGEIWVGLFAEVVPSDGVVREPERTWLVFTDGGMAKARAVTPEGFRLHAVQAGRALGVYSDEYGMELIRAYTLG